MPRYTATFRRTVEETVTVPIDAVDYDEAYDRVCVAADELEQEKVWQLYQPARRVQTVIHDDPELSTATVYLTDLREIPDA